METMNIALPESMKHFVQERVTAGDTAASANTSAS